MIDILNMQAGEEMDKLVAERVMKWKRAHLDYVFWQPSASEENLRYCSSTMPQTLRDFALFSPFHPSRDIADAWEVTKKIDAPVAVIQSMVKDGWSAEFYYDAEIIQATADTPSLAICRAALLAVMEEK